MRISDWSSDVCSSDLSRTNNTKAVAEIIHEKVGGDLVALELITPYPEDYQTTVDQVADENATGYLPPLKTTIDTIEKYDVVFIWFPRSKERRVGKECVSTCRSRWSP